MKTEQEILRLMKEVSYRELEAELGIQIRNGQTVEGVRKALAWVIA